jgi:hypothetical protein
MLITATVVLAAIGIATSSLVPETQQANAQNPCVQHGGNGASNCLLATVNGQRNLLFPILVI